MITVEPGKINLRLADNVALNGFFNVDVVRAALDASDGDERKFCNLEGEAADLGSFLATDVAEGSWVTVPTLDSLSADCKKQIRVVKLDLERAEVAALDGGQRLLREARSFFVVEVEDYHLQRHGSSATGVLELFAKSGYRVVDGMVTPPNLWFEPE